MNDQQLQPMEKKEVEPEVGEFTRQGMYFTPAVDICETETDLYVMVDMPGVTGEGVEIDLKDEVLSVIGKVAEDDEPGEELLSEYRTGNYFRNFHEVGLNISMEFGLSIRVSAINLFGENNPGNCVAF